MEAASDQIHWKQCNNYSNHLRVSQNHKLKETFKTTLALIPRSISSMFTPCLLLSTHQATRNPEKNPTQKPTSSALCHAPPLQQDINAATQSWESRPFWPDLVGKNAMEASRILSDLIQGDAHCSNCSIVVYVTGNQWNVNYKHTSMWNTEVGQ